MKIFLHKPFKMFPQMLKYPHKRENIPTDCSKCLHNVNISYKHKKYFHVCRDILIFVITL